jgi:Cytidylyltransferase-like
MFLTELAEPTLLVIYPGRFQPFHKGHYAVYEYLTGKFGRSNVYIATSNKTDNAKSPFTFAEKAYFMQLTGVPADRIVQATQPYQIQNVLQSGHIQVANPANTVVIFAVSEKDMADDPRFSFAPKKDGNPSYFQKLVDIKQTESMDKHGYIMTVPTFDFKVLNQPMRSGTELRKMYSEADEKTRQDIVKDLFGRYTPEAEQIMTAKIVPAQAVEPAPLKKKTELQKVKIPKEEPVAECGGTGVVASKKQAKDPRYSMSLTKDVRPGQINKSLKAFSLKEEDLAWVKDRLGESAVDELAARHIEYINQDILAIKERIATEKLPQQYIEKLKQKIASLEAERSTLAFNPK